MPRHTRITQTPALLPGREIMPLLQAMAISFARLLPTGMTFTLTAFDTGGNAAAYASTHCPVRHQKRRRTRRNHP